MDELSRMSGVMRHLLKLLGDHLRSFLASHGNASAHTVIENVSIIYELAAQSVGPVVQIRDVSGARAQYISLKFCLTGLIP